IYSEHITSSGGWLKFMESIGTGLRPEAHYLFLGAPISERPNLELGLYSYSKNLNKYEPFIELARDAENRAREQLGVPLIGEGWVSETNLFRGLAERFSMTDVIQHGRPSWLGRQHFDIFFPAWKVAVEYHGEQHFRPIDFFGGEDAFRNNV